jgi:Fe-S cluster assembly protein SufD
MSESLSSRIAADFATTAGALAGAPVATPRRRAALETLTAHGLPSTRDENWKYANLRTLERLRFVPAASAAAATNPSVLAADLPPALPGCARYLFVDGLFAPALSAPQVCDAARVTSLAAAAPLAQAAALQSAAWAEPQSVDERFLALNEAFATDGASIHVSSGSASIELLFVARADAQAGASYPRVELSLDAGASLTLIERHLSVAADNSFVNSAVTAQLGRGATLQHYRLQELGARAIVFDTLAATLAEEASYQLHGISTGAQSARSTLNIRLAGEGANLAMASVALGDRQQLQDTFALVQHLAPRTRTAQTFRGIAAGRARVAFNGKIVVANNAAGTDSQQSLRGLLAGADAEIDVRPQLEIYTDDVRCSHGATVGKLDDHMLFYLLSRGLEPDTAQRLLKWAFLQEVIARISLPALRREIEARLPGALQDTTLRALL